MVETDSLRYHRTPAQQNRDYERDAREPEYVLRALRSELARLRLSP